MRVALASCAAVLDGTFDADQDEDELAAALAAIDVASEVVDWRDAGADWSSFDAVVIRSTWDYTAHLDEYLRWTRTVEATGTPLLNSAEVVRWNTHKRYLIELEERGAPIVPTAWLAVGDQVRLADVAEARGWSGVVAKPAVGVASEGLLVVPADADPDDHQTTFQSLVDHGDTLVQPFVASVAHGELSVVVVDGRVSHAVRKVPADGEVRVQIEFGAAYVAEDPDPAAAGLAEWLVDATGHDLLYARVDLLADEDGSWMLGELELVEPALLLAWSDEGAARLAAAIATRLA